MMFTMNTVDFTVFGVSPYFFMAGIGAVAAYLLFAAAVSFYSSKIVPYSLMLFGSMIGLLAGARVFGVIVEFLNTIQAGERLSVRIFLSGGIVFYGGLTGFALTFFFLCKAGHIRDQRLWDIVAVCVPCFHGFARIGCFLAGCCYGRIYKDPGAVYYITMESAAYRFPVQLAESAAEFMIFVVLLFFLIKKYFHGRLFWLYLLLYAVTRFAMEFLRGDEWRGIYAGLSFSQWYSIFVFAFAAICLYNKAGRPLHKKGIKTKPVSGSIQREEMI